MIPRRQASLLSPLDGELGFPGADARTIGLSPLLEGCLSW